MGELERCIGLTPLVYPDMYQVQMEMTHIPAHKLMLGTEIHDYLMRRIVEALRGETLLLLLLVVYCTGLRSCPATDKRTATCMYQEEDYSRTHLHFIKRVKFNGFLILTELFLVNI